MNRQQAKELLSIIQAFAEGKTIQYYYTTPTPHWEDVLPNQTVDFNSDASKYRPFKNQNECWEEMLKHKPFGWIKDIISNHNVIHIQKEGITTHNGISNVNFSFRNAFNVKFADGTPFGIKE